VQLHRVMKADDQITASRCRVNSNTRTSATTECATNLLSVESTDATVLSESGNFYQAHHTFKACRTSAVCTASILDKGTPLECPSRPTQLFRRKPNMRRLISIDALSKYFFGVSQNLDTHRPSFEKPLRFAHAARSELFCSTRYLKMIRQLESIRVRQFVFVGIVATFL
jgi:hypothetical protein